MIAYEGGQREGKKIQRELVSEAMRERACLYSWWGRGWGQMACSGRGSGMKTEWVRWMGLEPGAERTRSVPTPSGLAMQPNQGKRGHWAAGVGRMEAGGFTLTEALGSVTWLCPEAGDV